MKTIRLLMMFAAWLLSAAHTMVNAQILVSQKEAVKAAVNYVNGYLMGDGEYDVDDVEYYSTETKSDIELLHEVHIGCYKLILSGVKSCKPVLMYVKDSASSLLLDDNEESGISYFLNRYCNEVMHAIDSSKNSDTILGDWEILLGDETPKSAKQDDVIGPLLTTEWGQREPNSGPVTNAYNYYVEESCSYCDTLKPPTGCVATAVGQIMNYWKHPVYRDTSIIQFDWCNMEDALSSSDPDYEIHRNAVARLLYEVGLAVQMNYCFFGCYSFATPGNAESALKNVFGYSDNAELRWRSFHSKAWKSMLINEITQERPIFYSAIEGIYNGHAFVVHGYNSTTDMFCVNFGHSNNETWTTIDNIGLEGEVDFTNMENAIFDLTPKSPLDYCDFSLNLSDHYQSYYSKHDTPEPYLCVPQTAATLISSNDNTPASWRTIPPGASSEYIAHKSITLQPGFYAELGSTFSARIVPCSNCDSEEMTSMALQTMITEGDSNQDSTISAKTVIVNNNDEGSMDSRLFPNPSHETITYQGKQVKSMSIFDMTGNAVFRWFVMSKTDDEITINIKDLRPSMYVLLLDMSDGTREVKRFIKE